jgi:hypothetical protein
MANPHNLLRRMMTSGYEDALDDIARVPAPIVWVEESSPTMPLLLPF